MTGRAPPLCEPRHEDRISQRLAQRSYARSSGAPWILAALVGTGKAVCFPLILTWRSRVIESRGSRLGLVLRARLWALPGLIRTGKTVLLEVLLVCVTVLLCHVGIRLWPRCAADINERALPASGRSGSRRRGFPH